MNVLTALTGWAKIVDIAIPAGLATLQQIEGWIRAAHAGQLPDAELNVLIGLVIDDATRRRVLAIADALGTPPTP